MSLVRLLVGSDFHQGALCERFEARLREDVVPLFLGDLVNRPGQDGALFHRTIRRWEGLNDDLVIVPGNHDPDDAHAWEGVRVHERRGLSILTIPVIPIFYKIPMWTHEHSEAQIASMLDPFRGGQFDVIASHGPPHGVCDRAAWGTALGSHALAAFARDVDFRLWLCGHVHEQRGAEGWIEGRAVRNAARTVLDLLISTV